MSTPRTLLRQRGGQDTARVGMAERCALFVIIALGESLLVTGATFAKLAWHAGAIAAFVVAMVGSVAYTYLHVLIVGGVIVGAVGDELILAHPHHATDAAAALALGATATTIVVLVAAWESVALRKPIVAMRPARE